MHSKVTHNVRSARIEQVFDQVLSSKPDERKTCLDRLCSDDIDLRREVESLLCAAEKAGGFLSIAPEAVEQVFADRLDPDALLGQHFGPYRLLHVLERGGMGVVFLAERADGHYDQRVAIKFANYQINDGKHGISALEGRFQRERQILANIRHPNVARLLDGGTSADGYPYLVMEYICGQPIDYHCHLNKLTPREILGLFLVVCETVQHAQQNLIVHCDLKPDNILVTADGKPKLLDFGIAQLLDPIRNLSSVASTLVSLTPMTPEFAAPEQLHGEPITTATDVYALGNVLYRLLTGVRPVVATAPSVRSDIELCLPQHLAAPSSAAPPHLRKKLRGDIDNIVMRAMSQQPGARYSSAQQMAEDIQRFLDGHVVTASNAGFSYRCGKFLRRHRLGAGLAGLSIVSILVGIATTTLQWQSARAEREVAENRLREVRELANTIVFDLPKTISALPGSTPLRERLLNQGIAYLDRLSNEQKDTGLLQDLAGAYHELATLQGNPMKANLGNPEAALKNYHKSIAIRETLLSDNWNSLQISVDLAASYSLMSGIHGVALNDTTRARALTDRCLDLLNPYAHEGNSTVVGRLLSCQTIGAHWANVDVDLEAATRYLEQAELLMLDAPDTVASLPPDEELRLRGRVHEEWAQMQAGNDKHTIAVSHERKRHSLWSSISNTYSARSRLMGTANHGLAGRLASVGNDEESLSAYQQALDYWQDWRKRYPADIGATQAIAVVHAEIADLHWRKIETDSRAHRQACIHYKKSIAALDESTSGSSVLATRYPWSPTALQIRENFTSRCKNAG